MIAPRNGGEAGAMNIDMHCHLFVEPYLELLRARGRLGTGRIETHGGVERILLDDGRSAELDARARDPDELARCMAEARIDRAVLSPPPMTLHADLGAEEAQVVVAALNRGLSAIARAFPERFAFFAAVPIQHPKLAAGMLAAIRDLPGAVGIEIPAVVEGRDLDDAASFEVLAQARDLGLCVFVHPARAHTVGLLGRYSLGNILANPIETTLAAAALAFGGVLERLPGLKILLCHGGGALPYLRGRMRHGYAVTRDRQLARDDPDRWLGELYLDTLTHDDAALAFLIRAHGTERLVLGTDHPFAMGEPHPVDALERVPGLTDAERRSICADNALRLVGRWP